MLVAANCQQVFFAVNCHIMLQFFINYDTLIDDFSHLKVSLLKLKISFLFKNSMERQNRKNFFKMLVIEGYSSILSKRKIKRQFSY